MAIRTALFKTDIGPNQQLALSWAGFLAIVSGAAPGSHQSRSE